MFPWALSSCNNINLPSCFLSSNACKAVNDIHFRFSCTLCTVPIAKCWHAVVVLLSPRQFLSEDYKIHRVVSYRIQYRCVCIFLSTSVWSPHHSFNMLPFKCCVLRHTVWLSKQKPVIEVNKTVSDIIPHKNQSSIHSSATHMIAALSYYGVLPRHQSRFHHHVKQNKKKKKRGCSVALTTWLVILLCFRAARGFPSAYN